MITRDHEFNKTSDGCTECGKSENEHYWKCEKCGMMGNTEEHTCE